MTGSYHDPSWSEQVTIPVKWVEVNWEFFYDGHVPAKEGAIGELKINTAAIESPGLLLPGVTVDDMKQGVSQIRNPVLSRVFRELELVEQWGSGVPGIFAQAKDAGLPEPTIEEIAGHVRFTVRLAESLPLLAVQSRRSGAGDALPLGPGAQSGAQSRAQTLTILQFLQAQALSSNEPLGPKNARGHSKRCLCAVQVMRKYDELFEEQA